MSDAWIKALRFAALPGAARVTYECQSTLEEGTPTTRHILRSFDADGQTMGDDRDYDLLKAVMMPLERLAEAEDHANLKLELSLLSEVLTRN